MNILKNKLLHFINRFAQYTVSGFYFWIFIIRGGIIYGFVPAAVGLVKSIDVIHLDEDLSIKTVFTDSRRKYSQHKWLSFCLFLFTGITIMCLYSPLFTTDSRLGFIQLPLIILTAILWTYSVYSIYFLARDKQQSHNTKWLYALAFDTCIRHPFNSLIILLMICALSLLIPINLLAFIFFAPPTFILLTKKVVYIPSVLR